MIKTLIYTNLGNYRQNNEDAVLLNDEIVFEKSMEEPKFYELNDGYVLAAVSDGMGGYAKGEVAAKITLESLKELKPKNEKEIRRAIIAARDKLDEYVKKNSSGFGMGCALAGLVAENGKAVAFNTGDCRVYRFIGNRIAKITIDHSIVQELILNGIITEEEEKTHPERNILTSAVAGDNGLTPLEIYTVLLDILTKDKFLICSDGLWEELSKNEIEEFLKTGDKAEFIKTIIKNKPLMDNISFIILEFN